MRVAHRGMAGLWLTLSLFGYALLPSIGHAAVQPSFDLRSTTTAPFPTDRFTAPARANLTNLRINLPRPNCTQRPSDCNDIGVLNALDGFNLQPRLSIPFTGPIDLRTVTSANVFLVRLGDVTRADGQPRQLIGINQLVWEPSSNTLYAESDELLEQHTRYLLVVTDGVRDVHGGLLARTDFLTFANNPAKYRFADSSTVAYRSVLLDAIRRSGVPTTRMLAASVFTTQSVTAELEKIRDQIKASIPAPADFLNNGIRTVLPFSTVQAMTASRQVSTTSAPKTTPMATLALLSAVPGSIGTLAFGAYTSPVYLNAQRYIPPTGTSTGIPQVQRTESINFTLLLPAGSKPLSGWPVAIFGTGQGVDKETIFAFAAVLASRGIATIGINIVGHGGGPNSTLNLTQTNGATLTIPAGGRSIDVNGDGAIDVTEGAEAAAPYSLINIRDGMRQTVIDLMQLTRVIETGGFDVNGDGAFDLDPRRIYYFGISLGGMYGTVLMAVEPSIRVGVANVAGSSVIEATRLGMARSIPAAAVATRTPSLSNVATPIPPLFGFNENMPLRDEIPRTNIIPGAIAIQELFDRWEWAAQSGDPLAYAPHIQKHPLSSTVARPFFIQFSKGDRAVPNPTTSALIRAGGLEGVTTYFRTDLAVGANRSLPRDPHIFLGRLDLAGTVGFARAGQEQIATLFLSDGAIFIDPDGRGSLFETPIRGALPETLGFVID